MRRVLIKYRAYAKRDDLRVNDGNTLDLPLRRRFLLVHSNAASPLTQFILPRTAFDSSPLPHHSPGSRADSWLRCVDYGKRDTHHHRLRRLPFESRTASRSVGALSIKGPSSIGRDSCIHWTQRNRPIAESHCRLASLVEEPTRSRVSIRRRVPIKPRVRPIEWIH